jgi:hypothetical protein
VALGEYNLKRKNKGGFPEYMGIWHSGKAIFLKKNKGVFPSAWALGSSGRIFKKSKGASPSAWAYGTRGRGLKNEFLPRVLHSGKRFF